MEAAIFDDLTSAGRCDAQPDAAAARAARADRRRAVHRPAASAVDRQPAPEDAVGCRLGRLAARRHEPLLHACARRARHATRRLWSLLREQVSLTTGADQDARRLKDVLAPAANDVAGVFRVGARGSGTSCARSFSARASHLQALPALLDERGSVGDLGCGTGQVAAALAPFVAQVIAVDRSGEMLQAARRRLRDFAERRRPARRARGAADRRRRARRRDAAARAASRAGPGAALQEAARVLKPGGRLLICDMLPHDREEYRQQMGHVWLGFSEDQMRRLLAGAGFEKVRIATLPADPAAKGPALFVAQRRLGKSAKLTAVSCQLLAHCQRGVSMSTAVREMHRVRRGGQGRPRAVQGQGSRRWPSSAGRKSGLPSRRCPA